MTVTTNRILLCIVIALLAATTTVTLVTSRAEAVTPGFVSVIKACGVRPDVAPNASNRTTVSIARSNTEKLSACLGRHNKIEFDAGHTFLIGGGPQGRGVNLRSGKHIKGNGASSKIYLNHIERIKASSKDPVRSAPRYKATGFGTNDAAVSNVTLENLHIEGRSRALLRLGGSNPLQCPNNVVNSDPGVSRDNSRGQNCRLGGAVFVYNKSSAISKNVKLRGVRIYDWPGVSVGIDQSENTVIENCVSVNPNKGGFGLAGAVASPTIANSVSVKASDGAIGLNGTNRSGRFVKGNMKIYGNTVSTRRKGNGINGTALHGTAIVIRGPRLPRNDTPDIYINKVGYSINNSISILDVDGVDPENVLISNNRLDLNQVAAIKVQSINGTSGIKINRNTVNSGRGGPGAAIAFVKSRGGGDQRWTNSEARGNDLDGKKVYVAPGIKGINK